MPSINLQTNKQTNKQKRNRLDKKKIAIQNIGKIT